MSAMTEMGNETPTMVDIIKEAIRQNHLELNTMIPAKVISYDSSTQTCEVQPSLKRTLIDPPKIISRPRLLDVPVVFPRAGASGSYFPLAAGDSVMLIFCQRSLDDWLEADGEVQVRDTRLHNISDAVVVPGLFPSGGKITNAKDAYTIDSKKLWMGDTTSTPLPLSGINNTEVVQFLTKFLELMATPLVSSMGPVTFDPAAVAPLLAEMKTALEALTP